VPPKATNHAERRAEIVRVAAELFDEKDYHTTNMLSIAAAANLQKASVYHYFKSKSDILLQIHNDFMELLFEQLSELPRGQVPPDERLRGVIGHIIALMETHSAYVRTFFEHYRDLSGASRREMKSRRELYEETIVEIIRDGVAEGIFRPIDPTYATMAIYGMCNWTYHWYGKVGPANSEAIADTMWDIVGRGMLTDAHRQR
jgi:TetR/AcrR family transcriptional regulator, cholesterol catabolism regulator